MYKFKKYFSCYVNKFLDVDGGNLGFVGRSFIVVCWGI